MDEKTRGIIENTIDKLIENLDVRSIMDWIFEEYPVESVEDFVLGFTLGSLARYAHTLILTSRFWKKIDKEYEEKFGMKLSTMEAEEKSLLVSLPRKDYADVRDMLARRLRNITNIIGRELHR